MPIARYSLAHPLGSDSFAEISTNLISSANLILKPYTCKYFKRKV